MALNLTDNWQMAKLLTDNWHLYPPPSPSKPWRSGGEYHRSVSFHIYAFKKRKYTVSENKLALLQL